MNIEIRGNKPIEMRGTNIDMSKEIRGRNIKIIGDEHIGIKLDMRGSNRDMRWTHRNRRGKSIGEQT